ncbi:phage/plasmid primase, P4 family [Streptomyces canus]|uniref:phage/plasmid primase, P4 family n=1 Tax=Streptomyces canus TaxID=58343 RepID=UPI003712E23C
MNAKETRSEVHNSERAQEEAPEAFGTTTPQGTRTGITSIGLSSEHREEILTASAVAPEVAAARGYETLHDTPENRARLRELGIPGFSWQDSSAWPGLLVPMFGATPETDSVQWKPARPQPGPGGKSPKYVSPRKQPNRIDVPAFTRARLGDLSVPLWVTEGIKKVDSLVSQSLAAVGITGVFNWKSSMGAWGLWEDVPLKGRKVIITFDADTLTKPGVRQAMIRFGAWLQDAKRATPVYLIVPAEADGQAVKGVDDFFAAGGTPKQLKEAATATPPKDDPDGRFTDAFLAEEAAHEVLDGRFCFATGLGWLEWTGAVWRRCEDGDAGAVEAWRQHVVSRYEAAVKALRSGGDRAQAESWGKITSAGRLRSVIGLAQKLVTVAGGDLDAHPDLLNTPSGVVDLTTGKVRPSDPDLYLTKITRAEYRPGWQHADWTAALGAVPPEVGDWLQVRFGQAVTGHIAPDDVVCLLHGSGENGKTTWIEAIKAALGDYYVMPPKSLLIGQTTRDESMTLRGARVAVIEETPETGRLDSGKLKDATAPTMTGHHLYQAETTWDSTHTLFLSSNYRPVVAETDHGTWRRLALVSFPYTFTKDEPRLNTPERKGDPGLRGRIIRNPEAHAAVLAWLVGGAARWYAADRTMSPAPAPVVQDTEDWRADADPIMRFWLDEIEPDPGSHVMSDELFRAFQRFLEGRGHGKWSNQTFGRRFDEHSLTVRSGARKVKGVPRATWGELSRAPGGLGGTQPTKTYGAWVGIRFRSSDELIDPFTS